MKPSNQEPLLVDRGGLAARLGISTRTLDRMLARGEIGPEPIRCGGRQKWRVADIQEWVAAAPPGKELPDRANWRARTRLREPARQRKQ